MMATIPALKEKRKKPACELAASASLAIKSPRIPPVSMPISFYIIKRKGREFWSSDEINKIIKLNEHLRGDKLGLRVRDFIKLWGDNRCCDLTGYKFGDFDMFDVGIDKINMNNCNKINNFRLVILPLALNRIRSKVYFAKSSQLDDAYLKRPVARAVLLLLRDAVLYHRPSDSYAINIRFNCVTDKPPNQPLSYGFTVSHYNYNSINYGGKSELSTIAQIEIDDVKQLLNITCRFDIFSYPLGDPSLDLVELFLKHYSASFKSVLLRDATTALERWNY